MIGEEFTHFFKKNSEFSNSKFQINWTTFSLDFTGYLLVLDPVLVSFVNHGNLNEYPNPLVYIPDFRSIELLTAEL